MAGTNAATAPIFDTADVSGQAVGLVQSSVDWLHGNWVGVLIALGVGTVIAAALFAVRRVGPRLAARSRTGKGWSAVAGRAIARTNGFFITMLSAKLVSGYAGAPSNVASTITFLWTVASVFQFAIWARELILGAIEHRTRADNYTGEALLSALGLIRLLVTFALFSVALVVVLDNLGVNVTGLVAGLGVGGIAIGLAAQGIFADLFAALAIIFDRPFRRGDAVTYDAASGTVEAIGLKSTRIRGIDGEERVISNKNLLDKEILNNTRRNHRRATFALGVAYQTPAETLERVPAMLKEVVEAQGRTFVRAGFTGFGASTLDFEVQFDSDGPDYASFYDGRTAVGLAILRRFNEAGIDLPFPTRTMMTAAPDGHLVMPWTGRPADEPPASSTG